MSKLYVSAVKRHEIDARNHGGLAIVDLDSWGIEYKTEVVYPMPFCARNSNPRGGTRGWRGIALWQDSVVIANNDSLVFFDYSLQHVKTILTHPSFASLHGICAQGANLFVASTPSDTYAVVDENHKVTVHAPLGEAAVRELVAPWMSIRGREFPVYSERKDYREEWFDDISHLNYVIPGAHGEVFALFNSLNMLIQLQPDPRVLWAPDPDPEIYALSKFELPYLASPHDLVEYCPGKLLINSSSAHALHEFDLDTKTLRCIWEGDAKTNKWLRGLQVVGDVVYIGTGTGRLLEVDLLAGELRRSLRLFSPDDEELQYAIFSVKLDAQ